MMRARIVESLREVPRAAWNALERGAFPFARHEFLSALEDSHCVGPRSGWRPFYVLLEDEEGLLAASFVYAKSNSYGEYVFDFSWAEAYAESGLPYYPKLVAAVPFVPANGAKILLRRGLAPESRRQARLAVADAWREIAKAFKGSSVHALFPTADEAADLGQAGFAIRRGFQFHWRNENYGSFDDFLGALRSKRRRELRREREQARRPDLTIERLSGSDLTAAHGDAMRSFYRSTVEKRGGFPYLTNAFFDAAFSDLRDFALFSYACEGARPIAGALGFFEGDALFGRWWGALEERRSLHFELSYYQGIEWCIERAAQLFEAGAQGEHKLARGFMPRITLSAHEIFEPTFARAVHAYVLQEGAAIDAMVGELARQGPFGRAE